MEEMVQGGIVKFASSVMVSIAVVSSLCVLAKLTPHPVIAIDVAGIAAGFAVAWYPKGGK